MVGPLTEIAADAFDAALHSGPRIAIMTRLVIHKSMRFAALQKSTALSGGNLTTHLSVLENAGYVAQKRDERAVAPKKMIRVTEVGQVAFRAYVRQLKSLITDLESRENDSAGA